ncbi:MAG: hypothetical protein IPL23_25660 [Saprospiraceae bacterium]|nr:hypothetical protein [Saprospiraceae bacterium]
MMPKLHITEMPSNVVVPTLPEGMVQKQSITESETNRSFGKYDGRLLPVAQELSVGIGNYKG